MSGKAIPKQLLPAEALGRLGVEILPSSFAQDYNTSATTQVPTGRVIAVRGRILRKIGYDGKYMAFERAWSRASSSDRRRARRRSVLTKDSHAMQLSAEDGGR